MATKHRSPLTVRLDEDLRDQLDRFVGIKNALGQSTTTSDVVRDALSSYLDGLYECLSRELKELL